MSVRAAGSRARQDGRVVGGGVDPRLEPGCTRPARGTSARAARCGSENVVRSTPPSGVAPIAARASKSARRRSASTRSTIAGDATAAASATRRRQRSALLSSHSWHEAGTDTYRIIRHTVVMTDNDERLSDERLRRSSSCNAIRIASTGTPSRR